MYVFFVSGMKST